MRSQFVARLGLKVGTTFLVCGLTAICVAAQQHSTGKPASAPSPTKSTAAPQPTTAVIGPLAHIQAPPAGYTYPDGDSYVYSVDWRIWNAGTVKLGIDSAGNVQRAVGSADSMGVVSLLYPVHDRFQSTFDPHTFCSQNIRKHSEEGFHSRDTLIAFDYGRHKSVLDETNLKNKQKKHEEHDVPGCVTDVLSGLLYLRSLPLNDGATYVFPLNDGNTTVDVMAKVEAREQVKLSSGTYPTMRVSAEAAAGPLKEKGKVWIWYSDDVKRVPVQMRGRLFWGTITFKLLRIEHKPPTAGQ